MNTTYKTPKHFQLSYLMNAELTEDDLYLLFEQNALLYSLIKAMHEACNEFTSLDMIANKIRTNKNWMNKNHFKTKKDYNDFVIKAEKVIRNVYQYSEIEAKKWVQCFMIKYGFPIHLR